MLPLRTDYGEPPQFKRSDEVSGPVGGVGSEVVKQML